MHSNDPELTMVLMWEKEKPGTVQDALNMFIDCLKSKFPSFTKDTSRLSLSVRNNRGKVLDKHSTLCDVVKHMDDLFVKLDARENETTKKAEMLPGKSSEGTPQKSEDSQSEEDILIRKNNAAIIHVGNGRYRKAIEVYKDMLKIDSKCKSALLGLVTCYKRAGRYEKALFWAKKALKLFENDIDVNLTVGEAYVANGDGDAAIEILMKCSKQARKSGGMKTDEKHELQFLLAKAYLLKEQKDMAITVLQGVLRENTEHKEALVEYSGLLFPLGPAQSEEAMSVLLSVLARDNKDRNAKERFAEMCQQPSGMKVLKQVASQVMNNGASLVFLGNCLKDCGALEESLELFQMAVDVEPSNASLALIYVHTLEVVERHTDIIKYFKRFCSQFPEKSIKGLKCSELSTVVQCIPDDLKIEAVSAYPWKPYSSKPVNSTSGQYTDEDRYLLAFWFTLVKVLYIKGQLKYISALLEMLEPLCKGHDLYLSDIRNEAAYFNCISELFRVYDEIPCVKPSHGEKYIYFIGDSHCIPPAWQKITVQDSAYIIFPVLSTGTKIWHLRSESNFYPKVNFHFAVQNIPDSSPVIVCLGEIDCREALLRCWEKARFNTIEDGMEALINIYFQVLKSLQKQHQWKIFIHPVVPVLDVTRPIVLQFNRILATKLLTEPTIHWLNFVKELLIGPAEGEVLKEEFRLDGTHLHPRYVSLLADSLSHYPDMSN